VWVVRVWVVRLAVHASFVFQSSWEIPEKPTDGIRKKWALEILRSLTAGFDAGLLMDQMEDDDPA